MAECGRCGRCCQDVRLAESPDMLERAYLYWKKSPSIEPSFSEIYLIYPMLRFVREEPGEDLPYHYTCVHYRLDDTGLPSCGIHPIRPSMCRDFPYYEDAEHLDREGPVSPYEGCAYNQPDAEPESS